MASLDVDYTIRHIPATLHIRVSRLYGFRMWLTFKLLLLAAWVSGWAVEVEEPEQ